VVVDIVVVTFTETRQQAEPKIAVGRMAGGPGGRKF